MQSGEQPARRRWNAEGGVAPREPSGIGGTIRSSDTTPAFSVEVTREVKPPGYECSGCEGEKTPGDDTGTPAGQDRRVAREAPPRQAAGRTGPDKVIGLAAEERSEKKIIRDEPCDPRRDHQRRNGIYFSYAGWNLPDR